MIHTTMRVRRYAATAAAFTYVNLVLVPAAHASGSSMPWEAPLQKILESIEGPVAKIVAVIIIIATGLALAFGDTSGGFRKLTGAKSRFAPLTRNTRFGWPPSVTVR